MSISNGVKQGVHRSSAFAVKGRNQNRGRIHHIFITAHIAASGIFFLDNGMKIALRDQALIALSLGGRPIISLRLKGYGSFKAYVTMLFSQLQNRFAEIEVAARRHAAYIMAYATIINSLNRIIYSFLQLIAAGVIFIASPRKLIISMPCEAAAKLFIQCTHLVSRYFTTKYR